MMVCIVRHHQGALVLQLLVLMCRALNVRAAVSRADMRPPIITYQFSTAEHAYKDGEDVEMKCNTNAGSNAVYEWRKDKELFSVSGPNITRLPDRGGSFIIKNPGPANDGVYQCFASNSYGTAVSIRTKLQKAYLDPFPTLAETTVHRPIIGSSQVLHCRPPRSYPSGNIYWGYSRPGSNQLKAIGNDARVLLSYEGGLYFANVAPSDSLDNGLVYVCAVFNNVMRALVHGDDKRIQPIAAIGHLIFANILKSDSLDDYKYVCITNNPILGAHVQGYDQVVVPNEVPGSPTYYEPTLMWSSSVRDIAIKGQNKKIKCIFSGLPTPNVTWQRVESPLSERVHVTAEGYGTEIEIRNVEFEDAGVYRCMATNGRSSVQARHDITLLVEAAPYWRNNRAPADIEKSEEEDVELECLVDGRPRPTIKWGVNGTTLSEVTLNPRWSVAGNRITIHNVTEFDHGIFQCAASNDHGSIVANAVLTVAASSPSFTSTPTDKKIVEGQSVLFTCSVYGAPQPKVTWLKGMPPAPVSGGDRYIVHSNGNLEIKGASVDDAGKYHCEAKNKFGTETASCTLLVRSPTVVRPSDVSEIIVDATEDVRIPCDVTTDANERSKLVVEWRKNGVVLRPDGRTTIVDPADFSLTIKQSKLSDSAGYTCHANNGLDTATSDVMRVTVRARPDPPRDVRVESCSTSFIKITWRPGPDGNSPIIEYIVYTIDSTSENPSLPVETARIDASSASTMSSVVRSRPWTTYKFHVVARNGLGTSDQASTASDGKSAVCTTPAAVPARNPSNVCSRLVRPTQLVIVWDPLPRQEQNGPGFRYKVGYRQLSDGATMSYATVSNPNASELVIHDQTKPFQQFVITVQSVNNEGEVRIQPEEKKIGYSGEGKPLDVPQNLQIREETLNSTYAEFSWDPIDDSRERIRGFFRGYQIQYWREVDQPRVVRTTDVILGEPVNLCPIYYTPSRRRRATGLGPVVGRAADLWPFSEITAGVLVLNQANEGVLSDTIRFITPQGVPDAISSLAVIEQGSSHLIVSWSPPKFPNGVLVSYILKYQVGPPNVGIETPIRVDPTITSQRLLNLEPSTVYRISLAAETSAGVGITTYTDGKTVPISDPDIPLIGRIHVGEDSANVSWFSSAKPPGSNPGAEFYVEYVRVKDLEAGLPWNRSYPQPEVAKSGKNWAFVGDLNPGDDYFFRVVAVNGADPFQRETRSDPPWKERIGQGPVLKAVVDRRRGNGYTDQGNLPIHRDEELTSTTRASSNWFIILMCIIALMLLILILACIIQRSRGQQYPVFEKEKQWGHDPYAPEDTPFGEYTRNNEPSDVGRSQVSLDSDDKPIDSETDSLGEYEDQDPSKFNEDGSFIGQYTRRNQQGGGGGRGAKNNPGTSSDTYNTFV